MLLAAARGRRPGGLARAPDPLRARRLGRGSSPPRGSRTSRTRRRSRSTAGGRGARPRRCARGGARRGSTTARLTATERQPGLRRIARVRHTYAVAVLERVEAHVRATSSSLRAASVTCLVSGGADSTCLWHAARARSATASARSTSTTGCGAPRRTPTPSTAPTAFGAEVVHALAGRDRGGAARAPLRADRERDGPARDAATRRPTRSRPCSTGSSRAGRRAGSASARADGVVRPLLAVTREETTAYCARARLVVARRRDERRHEARA